MDMLFRKRLMPVGISKMKMFSKGPVSVRPVPFRPMIGAGGSGIRRMV